MVKEGEVMVYSFRKASLLAVVLASGISLSGCIPLLIGAAAGAGGIAYIKGTLEQNLDRSVDKVHKAALTTLKELKITINKEESALHDSKIQAQYPDETKISIDVVALTEQSSTIKIRVGVFGDQEKSELILNAIRKKL